MKTAQDSYTITIKQIVRFQERMHLEKFQVDNLSLILTGISRFKQSWLNCLRPFSDSSNRRPTICDAVPTITNLDKCCHVFCDVWPKLNQPCFNVLCLLGMPPSKDEALTQGWFNVGPPSSTSAQH